MPDHTWIHSGKPDSAPGLMDNVLDWIKGNRETFIGSAVIILALIIFGIYFFMHYRELRDSAWKDLFIAQQIGYAGNVDEAKTKLDEISANYGNTAAGGFAVLTKGDMLFAQDKFKDAGAEYTKLLNDKNLGPFALYDLGKCAEASGDLAGAQVQYSAFLSRDPEHFMAPEVHSSLAHVQELAGQKDLAKTTYEKIVLLYPDTSWAADAKAKLEGPAPKAAAAPAAAPKLPAAAKPPAPAKK